MDGRFHPPLCPCILHLFIPRAAGLATIVGEHSELTTFRIANVVMPVRHLSSKTLVTVYFFAPAAKTERTRIGFSGEKCDIAS